MALVCPFAAHMHAAERLARHVANGHCSTPAGLREYPACMHAHMRALAPRWQVSMLCINARERMCACMHMRTGFGRRVHPARQIGDSHAYAICCLAGQRCAALRCSPGFVLDCTASPMLEPAATLWLIIIVLMSTHVDIQCTRACVLGICGAAHFDMHARGPHHTYGVFHMHAHAVRPLHLHASFDWLPDLHSLL